MSTFRNRTAQNAFTLLEVTIVMVMLVGLLACMASDERCGKTI